MGRKKTIDREALLDVAEGIVNRQGAAALTIDAVAKAAGITKGGVQYSFGSKDDLINAMFERWGKGYTEQFQRIAGDDPDPLTAVRAHVEATRASDSDADAKAASLMAALLQTPEHWLRPAPVSGAPGRSRYLQRGGPAGAAGLLPRKESSRCASFA